MVPTKEIEFITNKQNSHKENSRPRCTTGEFYQIFKKEKLTNLHAEETTITYLWRSQPNLNKASHSG